ncbi:SHUGOSHIN 1-like isoform X2 [Humulus lupulus]|uniref:SHUGOSHIN 1-like isoform X2 n=1 Tax=Humulus lupulus TaxID=3486 RepID=UPI002B415C04|nr:SHUGOSHIN 1-like isoform X2 [Humulus lupulus]
MDTVVQVDSDGSAQRKKLADISNLQRRFNPTNQDAKPKRTTITAKEYVEKLHKENTELVKLLADRNKLIELSAAEIQKLRISIQKVQLQNMQLAQTNSQMLAELNSSKDRLKLLQHELGCKNGLLEARKFEGKRKRVTCEDNDDEVGSTYQDGESLQVVQEKEPSKANHRKKSRTQSLAPPPAVKEVCAKEKANNKRRCSRRLSARFKSKELEETENISEREDDEFQVSSLHDKPVIESSEMLSSQHDDPAEANGQTPSSLHGDLVGASGQTLQGSSLEKDEENTTPNSRNQEFRRSSVGRPLRRAATKVQSYKELSVMAKMRRTE